jgi:hypothetical protein
VPLTITVPISVSMSLLSLGLTKYYSMLRDDITNNTPKGNNHSSELPRNNTQKRSTVRDQDRLTSIIFVSVFFLSILICTFSTPSLEAVFKNWSSLGAMEIVGLCAGILLTFFLPGYAVVLLLFKNYKISPILKILLAYLLSMLIAGLTVYLSELFLDNDVFENKSLILGTHFILLLSVFMYYRTFRIINSIYSEIHGLITNTKGNLVNVLRIYNSELLVFGSLLAILIISTNYLYGGVTIGDQWYHQNRVMLFISGQFNEFVLTNGDEIYPPLQSALLADLSIISGTPLVNSIASIAFLNITAMFAFYFFCSAWLPKNKKRAALLAASLFLIASGFGWIHVLAMTGTNPISSQLESIAALVEDKIKVTDIRLSANFMIAAFPDFSTALIYIALPAGFVLLGLVRINFVNKLSYMTVISLITILGILSHDEFYIFTILVSILPLVYNLQNKHFIYFALFVAFGITYGVDALSPERYYTFQAIFGMPLLYLCTIFAAIMFSLYLVRQHLLKRILISVPSVKSTNKVVGYILKVNWIPKIVLVGFAVYLYLLCFIVWDQLPSNYLDSHTQKYSTPWYLYPMRLGVIGLIGLASILSYVFKKYEKEVFVFGILIALALLAGPYYNEQRFNKYVMAGMVGFAAFLLFELLHFVKEKRLALNGIIVSTVVVTASLSTFMYVGYNALAIQTLDDTDGLERRNFPTEEELKIFDLLRSNIQLGSNPYNIATFSNEYNLREGNIMSKLHAFAGLPYAKISRTGYLLNASTLELFYYLLDNSGTKYIILPNKDINTQSIGGPMRFALDNFHKIYQSDNFTVLSSPTLQGPSTMTRSEVGIIHKDKSFLSRVLGEGQLPVTNDTFDFEDEEMKYIEFDNENKSGKATLNANKNNDGKTIWSNKLRGDGVNYIEFRFRILEEDKSSKGIAGLKWIEGNTTYFVSLSNDGLELRRQNANEDESLLLMQNSKVIIDRGLWHSINIHNLKDSTNIYVDDILRAEIPSISENLVGISNVGIVSENNAVEFEPIHAAKISSLENFYEVQNSNERYYPISTLALSGSKYSTFEEGDYSVLSKKMVIVPFDSPNWNDTKFNRYVNYAKEGGTLIVINSDSNVQGKFAQLFLLNQVNNTTNRFAGILMNDTYTPFLNISGITNSLEIEPSPGTRVIASYSANETKLKIPFAIEKSFANDGRIIYINAKGYFDAINKEPQKYFTSLSNFSKSLFPYTDAQVNPGIASKRVMRFIGDVDVDGKVSINSSSFSVLNSANASNLTNASNASNASPSIEIRELHVLDNQGKIKNQFENLSVTKMVTSGDYEVSIDSLGSMSLPATLSQSDYVHVNLPDKANLTISLLDDKNSHIGLLVENNSSLESMEFSNGSKLVLTNIQSSSPLGSVPMIVKNPVFTIEGNIKFEKTNFHGESTNPPLDLSGHAVFRYDFADNYEEPYRKGIRIQYLNYLGSITLDGDRKQPNQELKFPGDISVDIRNRGLDVPLYNIFITSSNISLMLAIAIGTIVVIWLARRRYSNTVKNNLK